MQVGPTTTLTRRYFPGWTPFQLSQRYQPNGDSSESPSWIARTFLKYQGRHLTLKHRRGLSRT